MDSILVPAEPGRGPAGPPGLRPSAALSLARRSKSWENSDPDGCSAGCHAASFDGDLVPMSLALKDVRKAYREPDGRALPILNIAEFALQSGEQAVLVGASGGGKTTLLNVIAGITAPDSGTVTIDGIEITRLHEVGRDRFRAQKIGFVFQTFNLLPAFSALENVLLGMSFSGKRVDRRRAEELLGKVGLSHRLHHRLRSSQMNEAESLRSGELGKEITHLLVNWSNGDQQALERLTPLVYAELRRLAARHLRRERSGHTLQSTALVHEAYLRLVDQRSVRWQNRAHFFGIAAQMIRRILVDYARGRHTAKRGADACKLSLDEAIGTPAQRDLNLVALDDALQNLAALDPQQSRIVELKFFGGLSIEEIAEVLAISPATVKRDWAVAKAWLYRYVSGATDGS
jgi:RNA polymerase sigma factor (TIGR02999 family)